LVFLLAFFVGAQNARLLEIDRDPEERDLALRGNQPEKGG
jgi:hypothetical protein